MNRLQPAQIDRSKGHNLHFNDQRLNTWKKRLPITILSNGLCILVKEDSDVLKCLKVNETINMEYNPSASQGTSKYLKTRISDITKNNHGGFNGHRLVGLSIIEEHDDHS
jgi:hypothetical protein